MSESPYITAQLKAYLQKHSIQKFVHSMVNHVLNKMPDDPYGEIIGLCKLSAKNQIIIEDIKGLQTVIEGCVLMKLRVIVTYLNEKLSFQLPNPFGIMSELNMLYDQQRYSGKGLQKGIQFLENTIIPQIRGMKCNNQQQIDKILHQIYLKNSKQGIYQIYSLSYSIPLIQSSIKYKQLYKCYNQTIKHKFKIIINCLNGGKNLGSKCKVYKFYLINKDNGSDSVCDVAMAVRKTIVSGKTGQAALKNTSDGGWVCPADTINDNLKIIQEAINSCNAKDKVCIGLSWMADSLYNCQTKKYQLQNPKNLLDNDQMIEYHLKLLIDHPLIKYIEDPIASTQKVYWNKLLKKLADNQLNVQVGSKNGNIINIENNLKQQIQKLIVTDLEEQIKEEAKVQTKTQNKKETKKDSKKVSKTQNKPQSNVQLNQQKPEKNAKSDDKRTKQNYILNVINIRLFQCITLTKLKQTVQSFNKIGIKVILQDNNLESFDCSIADICYALNTWICLGTPTKYNRQCKMNRIKQIEQNQ